MRKPGLAQSKMVHTPRAVNVTPALVAGLLIAGAASLTGCAASSNSGLETPLFANEQKTSAEVTTASVKAGQHTSAGRGSRSAAAFKSVTTPGNEEYKIGPLDVLEISVFKVPELSKSVQVADTGTVNLPLVGAMPAAGKTAEQLERELESKLGAKYLQSPQVTVYVKEFNSQRATIEGSVKNPGVHQLRGKTSLLQLVAMSGGLDQSSDSTAVVFRQVNGQRSAGKFDIAAIRAGRADDPAILKGDVIVVGESAIKAAFNNVLKALPVAGIFAPLL
jgi:polysaccharide export outer membrane protein